MAGQREHRNGGRDGNDRKFSVKSTHFSKGRAPAQAASSTSSSSARCGKPGPPRRKDSLRSDRGPVVKEPLPAIR